MDFRNIHFRSYVYTGFKLDKSALQLFEELKQVFGQPPAPSLRTVQRWIGDIKKGTFTLDKNVSTGRPRSLRTSGLIREVEDLTEKDPRMSTWELAELLHVDQTSIYRILTEDLEMKNVCSVWVPSELSEKKEDRIACCRRILENVSQCESGVYCVQDELWVNWSIVKSKQQNMTWIKKGAGRGVKLWNRSSLSRKRCCWSHLPAAPQDFRSQHCPGVLR